jgi:hypothetical protein
LVKKLNKKSERENVKIGGKGIIRNQEGKQLENEEGKEIMKIFLKVFLCVTETLSLNGRSRTCRVYFK